MLSKWTVHKLILSINGYPDAYAYSSPSCYLFDKPILSLLYSNQNCPLILWQTCHIQSCSQGSLSMQDFPLDCMFLHIGHLLLIDENMDQVSIRFSVSKSKEARQITTIPSEQLRTPKHAYMYELRHVTYRINLGDLFAVKIDTTLHESVLWFKQCLKSCKRTRAV